MSKKKTRHERFKFRPNDNLICPVCGKECVGFRNYCYYDCYTVRCYHCDKEYDYATHQHFLDNPKIDVHGNTLKEIA